MKKRTLSFALALLLCLGLAVPALAADTSAITWLQLQGTPRYYIKELDWLVLSGDDGGIVDLATGKQVMDYDYIYPFVNGLAEVVKYTEDGRQQHGFIGTDGTVVIPLEYEEIGTKVIDIDDNWALVGDDFSEPLIIAAKYNPSLTSADVKDWCIIDSTGKIIEIPGKYSEAYAFSDGMALVRSRKEDGVYSGYIDTSGREVIPVGKYICKLWGYHDGMALIQHGEKYGFINTAGEQVIPFKYDNAYQFSEGLAAVSLNEKWGFVSKTGTEVIPLEYDYVDSFRNGFAVVMKKDSNEKRKYGVIDSKGSTILPLEYGDIRLLSSTYENLIYIKIDNKYGCIDTTGKLIIPPEYDRSFCFFDGQAVVLKNREYFCIDSTGSVVMSLGYDSMVCEGSYFGLIKVHLDGKYGFIDMKGELLLPIAYDECGVVREGKDSNSEENNSIHYIYVKSGKKYGIIQASHLMSYQAKSLKPQVLNSITLTLIIVCAVAVVVVAAVLRKKKAVLAARGGLTMFCPNCGKELPETSRFCPSCGKKRAPGQPGTPPSAKAAPTVTLNTKTLLIAAGVVIVILLALLIFRLGQGYTPNSVQGQQGPPAPEQTEQTEQTPEPDPAAALVGTWSNKDGVGLRFTSDGTVTLSGFGLNLGGDTFSYEVTGENSLTLTGTKGLLSADIEATYVLLGNTLYIEIGGYEFELTKK